MRARDAARANEHQASMALLQRLDEARVVVSGAYRYWDEEADAQRLVLISPNFDQTGPRRLYRSVQKAIRQDPALKIALSDISILGPSDPRAVALGASAWVRPGSWATVAAAGRNPVAPATRRRWAEFYDALYARDASPVTRQLPLEAATPQAQE